MSKPAVGVARQAAPYLTSRDDKVWLRELVGHVPAQGAKLEALLDKGMEEAEAEQELVELCGPVAAVEELGIRYRVVEVGLQEVGAEALWRLVGHLDAVLEHRDREVLRGVRGQPQPELLVGVLGRELLADPLQRRHPGHGQVAVLQVGQETSSGKFADQLGPK